MEEEVATDTDDGFFTEDGWYFLGNGHHQETDQALGRHSFTPSHPEQWIKAAADISDVCRLHLIPCLFVISPAKWSIYRDKLENHPRFRQGAHSIFDNLQCLAPAYKVDLLDLRQDLVDSRKNADTYSPRDSHWNGYGAYVAWTRIAARLKTYFPRVEFFSPGEPVSIATSNEWDEATKLTGRPGENIFTFPVFSQPFPDFEMRYDDGPWTLQSGSRIALMSELPLSTRNATAPAKLKALLIRDSVGDIISPYFHSSFVETYQRYHALNVPDKTPSVSALLREHAPDVLIFLITERYLTLPLYNLETSQACAAFFNHNGLKQHWPTLKKEEKLPVDGWQNPKRSVRVILPKSISNRRYVKVSIYSNGTGTLVMAYVSSGQVKQKTFPYSIGASDHFLAIADDVVADHLWIRNQAEATTIHLSKISVAY